MTEPSENASDERPTRRVVVGIDGSPASRMALDVAIDEAWRRDATLEIVHAWSNPLISHFAGFTGGGPVSYLADEDPDYEGEAVMSAALEAVPEQLGLDVRSSLVEGHPSSVLVERTRGADLLVVGRRGRGHLATLLLGSTSRDCVEHAECPVLVVPVAASDLAGSTRSPGDVHRPAGNDRDGAQAEHRVTPRGQMMFEEIASEECLQLVARSSFGRVAFIDTQHQPLIVPVTYHFTPEQIVIRTEHRTELAKASRRVVALEVDDVNPSTHEGWSVLVRGQVREVTDAVDDRSDSLRPTAVGTWVAGEMSRGLVIEPSAVTGWRLRLVRTDSGDASA